MDIVALLHCLQPDLTATTRRQFSRIAWAMLVMTGRITMLGISRWAGKGGSYRTVQRFFAQALPWAILFWVFFRQHVYRPNEVYLLVGDEVVATKAGTHIHNAPCPHGGKTVSRTRRIVSRCLKARHSRRPLIWPSKRDLTLCLLIHQDGMTPSTPASLASPISA